MIFLNTNLMIVLQDYNKEICKQTVSLLCSAHHVTHIHTVGYKNEDN